MSHWLYIPFEKDAEILEMAKEWKFVQSFRGKRTQIAQHAADCLNGVEYDDTVYVLGHGNVGCDKIANNDQNATEELDVDELCERIVSSGLPNHLKIKVKLYACGAGAREALGASSGTGTIFASVFAKRLQLNYHYSSARFYGYTESVTVPVLRASNFAKTDRVRLD